MPTLFACHYAERTPDSSQFYFQGPKFYNSPNSTITEVRPPLLLLKESLKNSFLAHISFSMAISRLLD